MDTNQKLQKSLQKIAENSRELAKSIEDAMDAWENIERQMTFSEIVSENTENTEKRFFSAPMWTFVQVGEIWRNDGGEVKMYATELEAVKNLAYYKDMLPEAFHWKIQKIYVDLNGAKL